MSGPAPAVASTRVAVRRALAGLPAGPVLTACSGGPDSLVLAAATAFEAHAAGRPAGAVVVDHGLQPGSRQVAETAARACRGFGLSPVEVTAVVVAPAGEGPEGAARVARHAACAEIAERVGAVAVLLGHTLDDQAEQVLLGLARGSGARSLAGMPARRGLIVRPFLGITRATIEEAVVALGLQPWRDPTNADPALARSRVRRDVLPMLEHSLGPGIADALVRTADQLREDAELLDELAEQQYHLVVDPATPAAVLLVDRLITLAPALRRRVILRWLREIGCRPTDLKRDHVLAVDALATQWRGQGAVHLPGGRQVERTSGRLAQRYQRLEEATR